MRVILWRKKPKKTFNSKPTMQSLLLTNIKRLLNVRHDAGPLYGVQMKELPCLENAWLLIEGTEIAGFGAMDTIKAELPRLPEEKFDCTGRMVFPAWCDSHSHIVFSGSRENEFVDKINGLSYAQINARGGGILSTVKKIHEISETALFDESWKRLEAVARTGTGAIEIKSGYGLSLEGELKMLRVIRRLKEESSLQIKSSFLGAHTFPLDFRENHEAYIRQITEEMLPVIAKEKLADYIDVFCEHGFFNPRESEVILKAGMSLGLQPKMHVNQLHSIGGIQTGIDVNAVSIDHLEIMPDEEIGRIKNSGWKGICTLLPTAAFFLRMPFPPARKLIDSGCAVALASDYNPGSSPSGNMNVVFAMSCIQMGMLPEEALNAATTNGAHAMGLGKVCGSVTPGMLANLIITEPVPSLAYIPYSFGTNLIDKVMLRGRFIG
jgi:imidazolonepropionase